MSQEVRNLIEFIKNDVETMARNKGISQAVRCLENLAAEVEKQERYEIYESFCNSLKELFDEEDYQELVDVLKTRDYFALYAVLYKILNNYLTVYDVKTWLESIRTNDEKTQTLIIDYMSMRFHIEKES